MGVESYPRKEISSEFTVYVKWTTDILTIVARAISTTSRIRVSCQSLPPRTSGRKFLISPCMIFVFITCAGYQSLEAYNSYPPFLVCYPSPGLHFIAPLRIIASHHLPVLHLDKHASTTPFNASPLPLFYFIASALPNVTLVVTTPLNLLNTQHSFVKVCKYSAYYTTDRLLIYA